VLGAAEQAQSFERGAPPGPRGGAARERRLAGDDSQQRVQGDREENNRAHGEEYDEKHFDAFVGLVQRTRGCEIRRTSTRVGCAHAAARARALVDPSATANDMRVTRLRKPAERALKQASAHTSTAERSPPDRSSSTNQRWLRSAMHRPRSPAPRAGERIKARARAGAAGLHTAVVVEFHNTVVTSPGVGRVTARGGARAVRTGSGGYGAAGRCCTARSATGCGVQQPSRRKQLLAAVRHLPPAERPAQVPRVSVGQRRRARCPSSPGL
jgi:hypothetical protein